MGELQERALELVGKMTLEEKISQIGYNAPAIPRLGVRGYYWWKEAVHGVRDRAATSFPHGLGIASTFNRELVKKTGEVIGDEGRESFLEEEGTVGINYWCPTINMLKDPRWGRAEESYGEDPYLTGEIAVSFIKGMQGDDKVYNKTMATSKHFLGNSSDSNRCNGSSTISERDLHEYYTYAFKKTVEEGNVRSIMTSYNCVNDIPMSVYSEILTDLVRKKWGFDGFYVTDCDTLVNVMEDHPWRPDTFKEGDEWTYPEVVSLALKAGVDLNGGDNYQKYMKLAIEQGYVSEDELNQAVVRLFTERFKTGEFDGESCIYNQKSYKEKHAIGQEAHTKLAEKMSTESVVLLKNDGVLPLSHSIKKLVVVGDNADKIILGDYSTAQPIHTTTPLQGITSIGKEVNKDMKIDYIRAYSNDSLGLLTASNLKMFDRNHNLIETILFEGAECHQADYFKYKSSGLEIFCNVKEGSWVKFKSEIDFTQVDYFSIGAGGDYNPTIFQLRQGNPINGTLLAEAKVSQQTPNNWTYHEHTFDFTGKTGGYNKPLEDVYLVFKGNYKREPYLYSEEEKDIIRDADAVILYTGTLPGQNGYRESSDGENLNLVNYQNELIHQTAELNSNTVVYMQAVTQINVKPFINQVPAVLWCTYNGQAQGMAAGKLLFGKENPSGKLPFTWYEDVDQLADIKDYTLYHPTNGYGRTYQYFKGDVRFPFGYGLSYSKFSYDNLKINKTEVTPGDCIEVSFSITNESSIEGQGVPQIYVAGPSCKEYNRPLKQLKGFEKILLAGGETKNVTISLPMSELFYWDEEKQGYSYEEGRYEIQLGNDSKEAENLTVEFYMEGELERKIKTFTLWPSGYFLKKADKNGIIKSQPSLINNDLTEVPVDSVKISYRSTNTDVVTVDEQGWVRPALGGVLGTATIEGVIEADGKILSASYPVMVLE